MSTTRRGFLKILGLAPLLPLAAKLPGSAPAAPDLYPRAKDCVGRDGLTVEKLIQAKVILNRNTISPDWIEQLIRDLDARPATPKTAYEISAQGQQLIHEHLKRVGAFGYSELDMDAVMREVVINAGKSHWLKLPRTAGRTWKGRRLSA